MASAGRFLYIIGIAVTVTFALLLLASACYFFLIQTTPSVWNDPGFFSLVIGTPLLLTLLGAIITIIGARMQRGRSGRIGGIALIALGVLILSIGVAAPFVTNKSALPAEGTVNAAFIFVTFATGLIGTGYHLIRREPVSFSYPFATPDDRTYASRKRDLLIVLALILAAAVAVYALS